MIFVQVPTVVFLKRCGLTKDRNFRTHFATVGVASGVDVSKSGMESHKALGIYERYHHPHRNTFRTLQNVYINASDVFILSMAVKALKHTMGPEDLVPSTLIFREIPSTRVFGEPPMQRATLRACAVLSNEARRFLNRNLGELQL